MWKLLNILYRITSYVLFLAILLGASCKFLTFFFFHDFYSFLQSNFLLVIFFVDSSQELPSL